MGAFHGNKYSSLKFWVFHVTNGTVVFQLIGLTLIPGHHVASFGEKYEINKMKTNSRLCLLWSCLNVDSEVEANDVQCKSMV